MSSVHATALGVLSALLQASDGSRVSEAAFRRCFFGGLLTLGLHLATRGLW